MRKGYRWIVRNGDNKDLKGILSLREIVFGEEEKDKLDEKFWRWEFEEGPDGKALIYVVEDRNEIIGHFADIPRRFSVQGDVVVGTLSLDLMVHPDYWRRGIFVAMGRYGVQRVKQENGLFMTAFPIRIETIFGLKKIGWNEVVKLPVLVYPIRFSGILNRYLHFRPLSLFLGGVAKFFYFLFVGLKGGKEMEKVEIETVDSFDAPFDSFWQKVISLFSILAVRDRTFLKWRYLQHPKWNYTIYRGKKNGEMTGYIVLRRVDLLRFNSTVIVDLLALDEGTLLALVKKGIEHSEREGADLIGFMVPKGHLYHRILRENGFLPSPKIFQFMVYSQSDREIFLSPEKWYVNWGDTDVI
jgi:GNAT superfamily N-acetyltransferase